MASSSKHDVFISFRGEDTRDNFTGHLYEALRRKKIETSIDNELKRGDEISPALLKAIEGSKISVIVFSKYYASSNWCLDELLKILECKKMMGQIVMPVFYHVAPSDIRKQAGSFGIAFAETVTSFKVKEQSWRAALTEAASISGWDSSVHRPESKLVEEIIGDVLKKLNLLSASVPDESLVGINSQIEKVMYFLCIGVQDFRVVGIWGMGGIGKTTIANAIFERISHHFESCCFLENVREADKRGNLHNLRNKFFSEVLEEKNLQINAYTKDRLQRQKVLIVLDDVNELGQIERLFGVLNQFGPGSRVIITTRDKQVLKSYNIKYIYNVEKLNYQNAMQLFCRHAFKQNHPMKSYTEFSMRAVNYAQGIPLALQVLGASLCGQSGKHWESALNKLKRVSDPKINNVLRISYEGLDGEERNIFLDIACFLKGELEDDVRRILDGCYHSGFSGIEVPIDKSLITIVEDRIEMHDLLQEMGWAIVHQESEGEPGKRSRLLIPEDVYHVLTRNTGTETIKGIFLDTSRIKEVNLNPKVFLKMYNLRFLKIYGGSFLQNPKVYLRRGLKWLPDQLRYLHWDEWPLKSLPSTFCAEKLVTLHLPNSNIKQLWSGTQALGNLKEINLIGSKNLIEMPDLSQATNLERMNLLHCESLVEIPSSIQHLNKLTHLDLGGCEQLKNLPSRINLSSLEYLNLHGCSYVSKFPEISWNIKHICLDETAIEEVPLSIEHMSRLVRLELSRCTRLKYLPSTLQNLANLQILTLSGCTRVKYLPNTLQSLNNFEVLNLSGCTNITIFPAICEETRVFYSEKTIEQVPASTGCLSTLPRSDMYNCVRLKNLPTDGCKLRSHWLDVRRPSIQCLSDWSPATDLGPARDLSPLLIFQWLSELHLSDLHLRELPEDISSLSRLEKLYLSGNDFESIPENIKQLSKLLVLTLSYCTRLQSLPELPECLIHLYARSCISLKTLPSEQIFLNSGAGGTFVFSNCPALDSASSRNIVINAQSRIERTRGIDIEPDEFRDMFICLRGSDVPEWFSHQNRGSSIIFEVPVSWCKSKILDFALCLVIEDYYDESDFQIICECHLENEHDKFFTLTEAFDPRPNYDKLDYLRHKLNQGAYYDRQSGSDHVFLLHKGPIDAGEATWNSYLKVSFEFYLKNRSFEPLHHCKVKKCGARWLYDDDRADKEEEVEPAAKRLKTTDSSY